MLIVFILIIAMVSIIWAYISLLRLQKELKAKESKKVSEELTKGRVIYHAHSSEELSSS